MEVIYEHNLTKAELKITAQNEELIRFMLNKLVSDIGMWDEIGAQNSEESE